VEPTPQDWVGGKEKMSVQGEATLFARFLACNGAIAIEIRYWLQFCSKFQGNPHVIVVGAFGNVK
jgi:hypothetical protein